MLIFRFFFHPAFLIIGSHIVFNSILGLLSRPLKPNICADSLRRLILQCSALSIISTSSHKGRWFRFLSIYGPPYPTFQSNLVLLPSDVLLALHLVGDLSHLCIFYRNCKGWSKHSSWSCWIPLKRYLQRVEPLVNTVLMSYGLHIFWSLSAKESLIEILTFL